MSHAFQQPPAPLFFRPCFTPPAAVLLRILREAKGLTASGFQRIGTIDVDLGAKTVQVGYLLVSLARILCLFPLLPCPPPPS